MTNPLATKLSHYVRLSDDDLAALTKYVGNNVKTIGARADLIHEGDHPSVVNLILDGWACRYKTLEDGRRQIIAFFVAGDLCDLHVYILRQMDHSIGTLTPVHYVQMEREAFAELTANRPRITQALWWDTLVTAAVQREWTVNIGQRNAYERIAHLFCEMFVRLRAVDKAKEHSFDLPLTQIDIAEATGMTPVHVNRTIQDLRAQGLIRWKSGLVEIPDWPRLCSAALFTANYLHLDREGRHLDANE